MRCMLQSIRAPLCSVLLLVRMGLVIQRFQKPQSKSHDPHFEILKLEKSLRFMSAMWFVFNMHWDHKALQFHFIFAFKLFQTFL